MSTISCSGLHFLMIPVSSTRLRALILMRSNTNVDRSRYSGGNQAGELMSIVRTEISLSFLWEVQYQVLLLLE